MIFSLHPVCVNPSMAVDGANTGGGGAMSWVALRKMTTMGNVN